MPCDWPRLGTLPMLSFLQNLSIAAAEDQGSDPHTYTAAHSHLQLQFVGIQRLFQPLQALHAHSAQKYMQVKHFYMENTNRLTDPFK